MNTIRSSVTSHEEGLVAVVKEWLQGAGHPPSWRRLIWELFGVDKDIADTIKSFAEPVQGTYNTDCLSIAVVVREHSLAAALAFFSSYKGEDVYACALIWYISVVVYMNLYKPIGSYSHVNNGLYHGNSSQSTLKPYNVNLKQHRYVCLRSKHAYRPCLC